MIAGITREIIENYRIDARRVFIAGLSSGGAMALILGCTHSDLFSAVGVHSGMTYTGVRDPLSALVTMKGGVSATILRNLRALKKAARPPCVPAIVFHGDLDATVHPSNADQVVAHSTVKQEISLSNDAAINGKIHAEIHAERIIQEGRVPEGHAYTRTTHRDNNGKHIAEKWLIHGAGHAWSGGSSCSTFTDPKGPDASREMLRFFSMQSCKV